MKVWVKISVQLRVICTVTSSGEGLTLKARIERDPALTAGALNENSWSMSPLSWEA